MRNVLLPLGNDSSGYLILLIYVLIFRFNFFGVEILEIIPLNDNDGIGLVKLFSEHPYFIP